MLEVLFSESAGGLMAFAMGKHSQKGGPLAFFSSDGTPDPYEVRKIKEKERQNWLNAIPLEGNRNDIISIPLYLEMGDIGKTGFFQNRLAFLKKLFSIFPSGQSPAETAADAAQKSIEKLLCRARLGEPIRIWTSLSPGESCGALYLAHILESNALSNAEVTIVNLPVIIQRDDGSFVSYNGWGEVEPYNLGKYASFGKKAPVNLIKIMSNRWKSLSDENLPLRATVNGRLLSVPENFYDHFILNEISLAPEEFNEAFVIGRILGKYPIGLSDAFIFMRMETFIQKGMLTPITSPQSGDPAYHRMLRKNRI